MAQTVIGFFDDASQAQTAVQQLKSKGISRDRIDVSSGRAGTTGTGYNVVPTSNNDRTISEGRTVDTEGRNTNAITDFFNSLFGGKKEDADRYSRVAERSNTLVTVHAVTEQEAEMAADVLDDCGAIDVDERAAQYGFSTVSVGASDRSQVADEQNSTIERVEENLQVGKREIEKGGVRVHSRIIERPIEENIRLREEHVQLERNSVDRQVSSSELLNFKEQGIKLTERAEVPVVSKEERVVEEIKVSKDVEEREETIRDNVRHTEIDIDDNTTNSTGRSSTELRDDADSTRRST